MKSLSMAQFWANKNHSHVLKQSLDSLKKMYLKEIMYVITVFWTGVV